MKKTIFAGALLSVSLISTAQYSDPYRVIVPELNGLNGEKAVLVNYDSGARVDSVTVADGSAVFSGTIDEPYAARVLVDGKRLPVFIVESGTMSFDLNRNIAFGSPLNDQLNEINNGMSPYLEVLQSDASDNDKQQAYNQLLDYVNKEMRANVDNPIGYLLFMDLAYEMEPSELVEFVEVNPSMAKYGRVEKLVESNRKKAATSPGAKYIDFDVNGKKLSDYVGKDGKYLLVDFFASWCGPCLRQLPVLKELYNDYGDKLNVLGVAVWDEHDATLRAIEQHQLPWECIIDAETIPTDIYGISGIPCIMLIAPDGTIISRDLQGDALKASVAAELNK